MGQFQTDPLPVPGRCSNFGEILATSYVESQKLTLRNRPGWSEAAREVQVPRG